MASMTVAVVGPDGISNRGCDTEISAVTVTGPEASLTSKRMSSTIKIEPTPVNPLIMMVPLPSLSSSLWVTTTPCPLPVIGIVLSVSLGISPLKLSSSVIRPALIGAE